MANLTNIIGGQPFELGSTGNKKNNLLEFWRGIQGEYDLLKRTGGAAAASASASSIAFTSLNSVATGWSIGDVVYVTGSSNNVTRSKGTIAAVPSNTALTITMDSAYTNTDTTGYQIDKYDPKTLYIIAT